jgi:hypothetical protein
MVYVRRSLGESCSCIDGPGVVVELKKLDLGIIWLLCSDMLSDMLCWLRPVSTRCTFRRFLGGEGIQLEGLSSGLGSP